MVQQNKSKVESLAKEKIAKGFEVGASTETVMSIKTEIEKVNSQLLKYQNEGNLDKVAELTYSTLPSLEKKLKEAETPAVTRYWKQFNDHIFAKDDPPADKVSDKKSDGNDKK